MLHQLFDPSEYSQCDMNRLHKQTYEFLSTCIYGEEVVCPFYATSISGWEVGWCRSRGVKGLVKGTHTLGKYLVGRNCLLGSPKTKLEHITFKREIRQLSATLPPRRAFLSLVVFWRGQGRTAAKSRKIVSGIHIPHLEILGRNGSTFEE